MEWIHSSDFYFWNSAKKLEASEIWLRAYFDRHFGPVTLPLELKH